MSVSEKWWEQAPLVGEVSGNWWEQAPLVSELDTTEDKWWEQAPLVQPSLESERLQRNDAIPAAVMGEFNLMLGMQEQAEPSEDTRTAVQRILDAPGEVEQEMATEEAGPETEAEIPEEIEPLDRSVKAWRSFKQGNFGLVDLVGGAAIWAGMEETGNELREYAREGIEDNYVKELYEEFSWEDLADPDFYATKGVAMIPSLLTLIPVAIGGGVAAGAVAGAAGLGALGIGISAAVGSALAARPLESAMEAMGTYNSLLDQGVSEEVASEQAADVFTKNMALAGMDAAQFALAFAKVPLPLRSGMAGWIQRNGIRAAGFAAGALSEGYEEVIQGYFQEVGQQAATGEVDIELLESMKLASPEAKEAFVLGTLGGLGFQTTGAIAKKLNTKDETAIIQEMIDQIVAERQEEGEAAKAEIAKEAESEGTKETAPPAESEPKAPPKRAPAEKPAAPAPEVEAEAPPAAPEVAAEKKKPVEAVPPKEPEIGPEKAAEEPKPPPSEVPSGPVFEGLPSTKLRTADVKVDLARFQPREKSTPELIQSIVADFKKAKWEDPILWKEPVTGDLIVIAGHHRHEAAITAKATKVSYQILPEGTTEEQARALSQGSNLDRVEQTDWENAAIVRERVDKGDSIREVYEGLPGLSSYSKTANLLRLGYLNKKGRFKENWGNTEFTRITSFGYFVGGLRKQYSWLNDAHEKNIFDFLYKHGAAHNVDSGVPKEVIATALSTWDLAEKKPEALDFSKDVATGLEARADTAEASRERKEARRDMAVLTAVIGNPSSSTETINAARRDMAALQEKIRQLDDAIGTMAESQKTLFDQYAASARDPAPTFNMFTGDPEKVLTEEESAALTESRQAREQYEREQQYIRDQAAKGKMTTTEASRIRNKARQRWTRKIEALGQESIFEKVQRPKQAVIFGEEEKGEGRQPMAALHKPSFPTGGMLGKMAKEPAERFKGKGRKHAVEARTIIRKIEKALGVPVRPKGTRRMRPPTYGWYESRNKLIRLLISGDLNAISHEMAHHIERVIWGTGDELSVKGRSHFMAFKEELAGLDYNQSKKSGRRTYEGFAEYMRHWLSHDQDGAKMAPKFHKHFTENVLPKFPKIQHLLQEVGQDMMDYREQGAQLRVLSQIDRPRTLGDRVREFREDPQPIVRDAIIRLRTLWTDDQAVMLERMKEAGIDEASLRPTMNPVLMSRVVKGKSAAKANQWVTEGVFNLAGDKVGASLVEIIKPVRRDIWPFLAFAYAQHAASIYENLDRHMMALARGEKPPHINPGIGYEDAKFIMEKYDNPVWRKAAAGMRVWMSHGLQYAVDSGALDPKYKAMAEFLNPQYLMLKRSFDEGDLIGRFSSRRGMVNQAQVMHALRGSGRAIKHPIDAMIAHITNLINTSDKTRVVRAIVNLQEEYPGMRGLLVPTSAPLEARKYDVEQIIKAMMDAGFEFGENLTPEEILEQTPMLSDFITLFGNAPRYTGKGEIVYHNQNGVGKYYEIPDKGMAEYLKGIDPLIMGPAFEWLLAKPTRAVRFGATVMSAPFSLIRNPMRDMMLFAVTSEYAKLGPFSAIKGHLINIADIVKIEESEIAKKFRRMGVEMHTFIGQDIKATKGLSKMVIEGKTHYYAAHPFEAAKIVLGLPESGTRIAEFAPALEEGEQLYGEGTEDAVVYATNKAIDVTINFWRGGVYSRALNQIYPFWGPNVQGPIKLYRSLKFNPKRTIGNMFVWIGATSLLFWYLNRDEEWYNELSAWERATYWHFSPDDGDTIVHLNKPFEVGILANIIEVWLNDATEEDKKLMAEQIQASIKQNMPPNLITDAAFAAPMIDLWRNKDFADRPVLRADLMDKPPEFQFDERTYQIYIEIGKYLKISPKKMQYLVNAYSGGFIGRMSLTLDAALAMLEEDGRELTVKDIPVVGTIFKYDAGKPSRTIERFYNERLELSNLKAGGAMTAKERGRLRLLTRKSRFLSKQWTKLRGAETKKERKVIYNRMSEIMEGLY